MINLVAISLLNSGDLNVLNYVASEFQLNLKPELITFLQRFICITNFVKKYYIQFHLVS
jgi:hypothetical protein